MKLNIKKLVELVTINSENSITKQVARIIRPENKANYPYICTYKDHLIVVFNDISKLKNLNNKSFIDIGAGTSQIADIAEILGFKSTVGLEYEDLYIKLDFSNKLIKGDLLDFNFKEYDVLYSYNPICDNKLMFQGIKNIINTMKKNSIFYFNNASISSLDLYNLGFTRLGLSIYKYHKK